MRALVVGVIVAAILVLAIAPAAMAVEPAERELRDIELGGITPGEYDLRIVDKGIGISPGLEMDFEFWPPPVLQWMEFEPGIWLNFHYDVLEITGTVKPLS